MRIALAFQGGGSHTAFTAGVVARWVERGAFDGHEIVAVSGTSGGAINALLTWSALRDGRPDRIPGALEAFWEDNAARSPIARLGNAALVGAGLVQSVGLGLLLEAAHITRSEGDLDVMLPTAGPARRLLDLTGLAAALQGTEQSPGPAHAE